MASVALAITSRFLLLVFFAACSSRDHSTRARARVRERKFCRPVISIDATAATTECRRRACSHARARGCERALASAFHKQGERSDSRLQMCCTRADGRRQLETWATAAVPRGGERAIDRAMKSFEMMSANGRSDFCAQIARWQDCERFGRGKSANSNVDVQRHANERCISRLYSSSDKMIFWSRRYVH